MFPRLHLLLFSWLCAGWLLADGKPIRLRQGVIETPEPSARSTRVGRPAANDDPPVSGLYLVQLTGKNESAWRSELKSLGVDSLYFIPEDAFLTRVNGVRLEAIRALPFVRWVGPFEPRHKLDGRLTSVFLQHPGTNVALKILLHAGAQPEEVVFARSRLVNARVHVSPSFGTIVTGQANARRFAELVRSSAVVWLEPAPRMRLVDEIAVKIVAGDPGTVGTPARVHDLGFDGSGVTVSVADSGLDLGDADLMHADLAGRVDAFFAYDNLPDASDEHSHGTHCAGIVAGNAALGFTDEEGFLYGLGVAPGAHLVAQRIFDGQGGYRPAPSFETLTRDAVRAGAYIGSNSWGDDTQGQYDLSAAEFDALVRDADALTPGEQAYVLEFSAGNAGPGAQTIGSPAVAKNVIATGACQNDRFTFGIYAEGAEVMADFSSRGPCADGRIKPDVTAPGTWIASLKSQASGEENAWSPISNDYLYMGGTSQSGPHASGACAVIVQWYRSRHAGATPSPALVKAALINSADDMDTALVPGDPEDPEDPGIVVGDTGPVPNSDEGWGRINLENLITSERRYDLTDQGVELATGQVFERRVVVGAGEPLKATLVYTDVPGLPAAIPALVNDLDLEAVSPSGLVYRGNAFANGESVAGTTQGDRLNNVEGVHLAEPQAGEWVIRVRAANVVQDVHRRNLPSPKQDFALVVSGSLPAPGEGVVSWDREAYRAPMAAGVRVVDEGLRFQPTATVSVTSLALPAGVPLVLHQVGTSATYTGAVQLVTGQAGVGQLPVGEADALTVIYTDASPAGERRAVARVDNQVPVIGGVTGFSKFGRLNVECTVSEPAAVSLYYGTTNAVTNRITALGLRTQPQLVFPALTPEVTYFYYLVAEDAAGNVSTNNNLGLYFRVVAPRIPTALLVYSPEALFQEVFTETPYPGIENWTGTLDALGIDYEVWDTSEVQANGQSRGAPTAAELKPYRLVLWRPEELQAPVPGITTSLAAYVAEGGALFVASYDLLSRLAEVGQSSFASQTLKVTGQQIDQGALTISAVRGDPIGAGARLELSYQDFPSGFLIDLLGIRWEDGPDHLQVGTNGAPVWLQEDGRVVGVRYPRTGADSVGRVVYLSFAFEALPVDGPAPNNRETVMGNALEFLVPGLRGLSTLALNSEAYTVPGAVTLEVSDARRAGSGQLSVKVTTTSDPTGATVDCAETPLRGVFRGQFVLIEPPRASPAADPPVPTPVVRLPARHGDVVTATYVDLGGRSVVTDAGVDTVPPVVTVPTIDPAYNEAVITWETDKQTDALVRFGESPGDDSFLTRSAYVAEQGTQHEVLVSGLLPDRNYYFQIVSRDAAGNVTTDDKSGELYQFRTLKPLSAPWLDELESGRIGWAVYDDSASAGVGDIGEEDEEGGLFSGTNWSLGRPENTQGVSAYSGTQCWATNLKGEPVDFAITDLISPAVSLVGGNQATLRFRQNFDFSSTASGTEEDDGFGDLTIEAAQVAVSADNGASWTALYANSEEVSDGWEQVSLDLSKFLGKVVRFRFNYQLFSFSTTARLGWLVDDVAVDVRVVAETGLVVSNNLAQASFQLRLAGGETSFAGSGLVWRTNLAPGTYEVTWNPVPFYVSPAPQTGVLGSATNRLVFLGAYTFPDANTNGLSDLWEQRYFGGLVTPEALGDADQDGATDRMEFLAGTNPRESSSVLKVAFPLDLPNRTVRLEWPTEAGREYVLEGSEDLLNWQAYSTPTRSSGGAMSLTLPALDPRLTYLFRVRVTP